MATNTGCPDLANVRQHPYRPISVAEYRVVHILPGAFTDDIQCVLETRSFKIKTRYAALSYQWGDELNTMPIRLAHLDPTIQQPPSIFARLFPNAVFGLLKRLSEVLQGWARRYALHLKVAIWAFGSGLVWRYLMPLPVEKPDWVPNFISRAVYISVLSMIGGVSVLDVGRLILEVVVTRPWTLGRKFNIKQYENLRGGRPLEFENIEVTSNLALALRYLRQKKKARTLWIDALCINQNDEDEKMTHIQHMDLIYANASPVVIWLGGYHRLGEEPLCPGTSFHNGVDCEHRLQISAAFHHIWTRSGWRMFFSRYFNRREEERFRKSRSGLCEIAKRDWWQRLWVIQEVALATGLVHVQCGYNTCDYEAFDCGKYSILLKYPMDRALQEVFAPSEAFRTTIKACRYSSFHDREGVFTKTFSNVMRRVVHSSKPNPEDVVRGFHEQPFPQRLQRILLRTAGRFKCRDDRDRVLAVLGVAAGSKTGEITRMARIIETLSSHGTQMWLGQQLDQLWGGSNISWGDLWRGSDPRRNGILLRMCAGALWSSWGIFYSDYAKHWTVNRPYYEVSADRNEIAAVTSGQEGRLSRVEFFTVVAGYLAKRTSSLSLLDAANCGEDEDENMPSWVPSWSRTVSNPAHEFAYRTEDRAADIFMFSENGKVLTIGGHATIVSKTLGRAELTMIRMLPLLHISDILLVLPKELRQPVQTIWELITSTASQPPDSELRKLSLEAAPLVFEMAMLTIKIGLNLLEAGGTAVISNIKGIDCELGFIKAGNAVKGDRLVTVPGCYHRLVLRKQQRSNDSPIHWRLVGLVEMRSGEAQEQHYSKDEWAQLLKDKVVRKFSIV